MIKNQDSLQFLKTLDDYSVDINYSDPPYALGSEIVIREDGKVDYRKAVDFMSKWDMPTGSYWEEWFKEAYRSLKYGGYCIMFGMDRQLLLFKYYAQLAGFKEQQSMYWYFISGFPKATDLSLNIDKKLGLQGQRGVGGFNVSGKYEQDNRKAKLHIGSNTDGSKKEAYSEQKSDLAKKYKGYKYSIAPLKQTNETIMIFQKPYKTKSCLHDTLAYENGDEEITCGALDIDGNRVGTAGGRSNGSKSQDDGYTSRPNKIYGKYGAIEKKDYGGRFPAQTFVDSEAGKVIDKQSGVQRGGKAKIVKEKRTTFSATNPTFNSTNSGFIPTDYINYGDTCGASRILHTCDFEKGEYDLIQYQSDAIMKVLQTNTNLCNNVKTVKKNISHQEKRANFVQENVQENIMLKNEDKNLENFLNAHNVEWKSMITQLTEQDKILSALDNVLLNLDLVSHSQYVQSAEKTQKSTDTNTVLKLVKTLIIGTKESMAKNQLQLSPKNNEYIVDLILEKEDLVIEMLNVIFAITKHKTDTTQIMNILRRYITFVKVATQKYIEEISSCHYLANYEKENYDIYNYKSKVSKSERNAGVYFRQGNNHVTLKPISLNKQILSLFKTPNPQKIVYPFLGSGSEVIGGYKAGFKDWSGCELSEEYCEIAKARIKHWTKQDVEIEKVGNIQEEVKEPIKEIKSEKELTPSVWWSLKYPEKKLAPSVWWSLEHPKEKLDKCPECGGRLVKTSRGQTCEDCLNDY